MEIIIIILSVVIFVLIGVIAVLNVEITALRNRIYDMYEYALWNRKGE